MMHCWILHLYEFEYGFYRFSTYETHNVKNSHISDQRVVIMKFKIHEWSTAE